MAPREWHALSRYGAPFDERTRSGAQKISLAVGRARKTSEGTAGASARDDPVLAQHRVARPGALSVEMGLGSRSDATWPQHLYHPWRAKQEWRGARRHVESHRPPGHRQPA